MSDIRSQKIIYAVGHRWNESDPDSDVSFYAYGKEIFHGTIEDAESFREYCHSITPTNKYRIYQLIELPEIKK